MFMVRFADEDGWLEFSQPSAVLRAGAADETDEVLAQAERALRDGAWIAGIVPYERAGTAIGIFDMPAKRREYEPSSFSITPPLASLSPREYRDAIDAIQRAIFDGDVYQVNFTVRFALGFEGDPFSLWYALARRTGARYQSYLEDGSRRVLSWSPELFLALDGNRVTTAPMKGTSPPDDTRALDDEKNRAEHVMIVDLLRNDLRRFCSEVDVEALCTIERYPTFATMTSTIAGTMREEATLADAFRSAFPCGSITGAPKRAAIDTIARLERHERRAYCGSLGYLSPQRKGWWNVAIRTLQIDDGEARFDAGGGIVSDSEASDEWNEILVKSSFLSSVTHEFELWETFAGNAERETIERHVRRLAESAQRTGIPLAPDVVLDRLLGDLDETSLMRVRVALDGTLRCTREPLEIPDSPVTIRFSSAVVRRNDPWLRVKSSWRPAHREAWAEAVAANCFDALLRNESGEITEGSRTNVYAEIDGTLYTPPISSGLLPGILRTRLLAEGRAHERVLSEGDVRRAAALYVGNSARGLLPARLHE